jgi:hypothetical protein
LTQAQLPHIEWRDKSGDRDSGNRNSDALHYSDDVDDNFMLTLNLRRARREDASDSTPSGIGRPSLSTPFEGGATLDTLWFRVWGQGLGCRVQGFRVLSVRV